ncbi:MAG: hypothetical protein COA33_000380 [Fluviicola sp.]|nr:hypothetical protein [Fluviicola sp.]
MSHYEIIKTLPGEKNYPLFEELIHSIYAKNSPRFILGNDPVPQHLEACYVLLKENKPVGRFAFYENANLFYKEEKTCCIGSYECIDDVDASNYLIHFARELAKKRGSKFLLGPMEGSTWNNYRFSEKNDRKNFFMEPYHHIYYNQQFLDAGFKKIAQYDSNLDSKLTVDSLKIKDYEVEFTKKGANFRTIRMDDFENELRRIGKFSIDSFADNFLYTSISPEDFVSKYLPYKKYFDARMIWIVENPEEQIQAIIFAIKDYHDTANETFIIKTIARRKESTYKGIGSYLAVKVMQIAKELGYKKVIHALMIQNNASVKISKVNDGDRFKSYALYALKTGL